MSVDKCPEEGVLRQRPGSYKVVTMKATFGNVTQHEEDHLHYRGL